MWKLLLVACLSLVSAQYNSGQYNHQQYGGPSYQSNSVPHSPSGHSAAPVHYVSIGQQLQGDYKFGYDAGNGAFREETRLPDGTVMGQYGYVDANGQKRVVKYRAGKEGYVAEGDGIEKPAAPQAPQQPAPQAAHHYNPQPAQHNYNPQPAPQHHHNYQPAPQHHYNHYSQSQNNQYSVQAPQQQYTGYPFTYITHENHPQSPLRQNNNQYQG